LIVKQKASHLYLLAENGKRLTTQSGLCLLVERDLTISAEFSAVNVELQGDGTVTVTWAGDFQNIASFTILHSTDGGETWQKVGAVAGDERSFNFAATELGATKVLATSASGNAVGSSNTAKDAADDELSKPSYLSLSDRDMHGALKDSEEAKRRRVMTPQEHWQQLMRAIEFAERNTPPAQRRNRPRWAHYARPLEVEDL
jgi:hypothetical protein